MKRLLALAVLSLYGCSTSAPAVGPHDPDPFVLLENTELQTRIEKAPVTDDLSFDALLNAGEHSALMVHRTGTGEAELHDHDTDFWVVREGGGMLIYGGDIVQPRTIAPGEIRGSSIRGGTKQTIATGDVVNIPPGMPHQIVLGDGRSITYLIVKVRER